MSGDDITNASNSLTAHHPYTESSIHRPITTSKDLSQNVIFAGNLSYFCEEQHLRELFSQCGYIERIRVCRSDDQTKPLLYGFVTMALREDAERVLDTFHGYVFMGRKLRLAFSGADSGPCERHEGVQIHVSFCSFFTSHEVNTNLPLKPTENFLRQHLEQYGEIVDVTVKDYQQYRETNMQEGYGFVTFRMYEDAMEASRRCQDLVVEGITLCCTLTHRQRGGGGGSSRGERQGGRMQGRVNGRMWNQTGGARPAASTVHAHNQNPSDRRREGKREDMIAAMDTSRSALHHQEYQHKQYNVGMDQRQATEYADSAFSRAESGSVSEPSPKPVPMSVAAHSEHVRSPMQMGVQSQTSSHSMHQRQQPIAPHSHSQQHQQPFQADRYDRRDRHMMGQPQTSSARPVDVNGQVTGSSFPFAGVPASIYSAQQVLFAHPQHPHSQSHSHLPSASLQYSHVPAQQPFGVNMGTMVSGPALSPMPGMHPSIAVYGDRIAVEHPQFGFGPPPVSPMRLGAPYGFPMMPGGMPPPPSVVYQQNAGTLYPLPYFHSEPYGSNTRTHPPDPHEDHQDASIQHGHHAHRF